MTAPLGPLLLDTTPSDAERAMGLLVALGAREEAVVLSIGGNPIPKPRPRVGSGRAYPDARQAAAEEPVALGLRQAFPAEPLRGNLALVCLFYRGDRRQLDRDNLTKAVEDAGNGIAWADDSQLTAGAQLLELDRALPRTVLAIAPVTSTMERS